jgi:adhesin transport system outer membrane protein
MMKSRRIILFLISAFSLIPLHSQEIYDLNRCITTGLERNFSILIARNQQEISSNNYTVGNAGFLPSLDLNSFYGGTVNTTKQAITAGGENVTKNAHNTSGSADAVLGWTIFQGFSAHTNYKKLNELKLVGELNTQMAVEDFMAGIVSEYYYYVQQLQLYHNLAYAVSLSRERVRIDEERYLLGAASKLQLLQSQVYLNSDSSRYAKQNEILRSSQIRINKLMASDNLGENIVLKDSVILINAGLLYDSLLIETQKSNTGLLIARKNQTISEYDYKIIAARTYPYLNFTSGYNFDYYTYDVGIYKNQQISGMNYGMTLGVNLFDGFNKQREKANARIAIDNKQYQYQQVNQQVEADLITIYFAYRNNLLLLKLEDQNLKTARENLDIALERYKLGSLSGLELREVQQSLLEAEERLLSVQYQTKLAEISLLQITGRIMEYLTLN